MSEITQRLVAVVAEYDREIDRLRAENERLRAEALIHERGRAEDARDHHGDMAVLHAENERLRADNERLETLEAAVRDLLFDADEYDCNGLGLHALHNAWSPVHKALDAIDAAMKDTNSRKEEDES